MAKNDFIRRVAHHAAIVAINRYVGHKNNPPDYHKAIEEAQDVAVRIAQQNSDKCQFCYGAKGGVPGNENRIGGVIVCDYCHALYLNIRTA